ncbi:RING-H2 finger protein ATL64-like [Prosopis cineraria]|uniref:RING-H2 finger protein ATL64-like n=1 Tax=Prosopis cineraria TaxID=364024 RepID=UPI00240EB948|nr:RING-H2 finger protein ATL64-like [Prosopis cineraria]
MSSNSGIPDDDSWFWEQRSVSSFVIFSAIFIMLSFYSIFQCVFYRNPRTSSSRSPTSRSRGDLNEPNLDDRHSIQIQDRALEMRVISSLPMSQFKKNEAEEKRGTNIECAICLGEFEEEEWVKRLPSCSHVFHVSCIDTWFRSPLCRSYIYHNNLALFLTTHR